MKRVIVAGGTGFFGRAALELLAGQEVNGLAASRRAGADLQIDVENADSLRRVLERGDIVIDTVGPFQDRTTTLIETALEIGCDVIDISDSFEYAQRVYALRDKIAAAGIRVLPSCSSVSAVSAMLVADCGIESPLRASGFLIPSARYSASAATADSLLRSVGRPVHVWRDGRMQQTPGWLSARRVSFSDPLGIVNGHLFESADSFWLPQIWPTLKTVEMYVDTRIPGLNRVFGLAARSRLLRSLVGRFQSSGQRLARRLGRSDGCFAVEVESTDGQIAQRALYCPQQGYRLAVLPATLAAATIAQERLAGHGLIRPERQVASEDLWNAIHEAGFPLICRRKSAG